MAERVVGVDLGGTKIAAALVHEDGRCGEVATRPTPGDEGPDAVLAAVADAIDEAGGGDVSAVGVGAAGVIDSAAGVVVSATDAIRDWPGTDIVDVLHGRLGVPVVADNDVNAHAAGEAWRGAGREAASVLMVTVGTGVGGAVVVDGHPLHGAHQVGGEIGHAPARGAEHLRCGCGRTGHLEAIASGTGVLNHYRSLGGDPDVEDSRTVVARAEDGEQEALRAVVDAATALGSCLAGAVTLVDPEVVIVGGGLAEAGDVWWRPLEESLRRELIDVVAGVPLLHAELGAEAAVVGAARLAWLRTHHGDDRG